MMSGVITSWTRVALGSLPSATPRTVTSRSVSIPTSRSLSPQTGSGPTSNVRIFWAASWRLALGRVHSTPRVMTSFTSMVVSFHFRDLSAPRPAGAGAALLAGASAACGLGVGPASRAGPGCAVLLGSRGLPPAALRPVLEALDARLLGAVGAAVDRAALLDPVA